MEKYYHVRHELNFYTGVALTATYRLPDGSSSRLKDHVHRACAILIKQHPVLSVNVRSEGSKEPYFVRLPEINLGKCVLFQQRSRENGSPDKGDFSRDVEVDELLQNQLNTPFVSGIPLWRLCILEDPADGRNFTAAFVYHHLIGDGGSAMAFHNTFAKALQESLSSASGDTQNIIIPSTSPLLPNMEQVMPLPLSLWYLVGRFWNFKFPRPDPAKWSGSHLLTPLVNNMRHFALSSTSTAALREACKSNGSTITAMLQILIARTIFNNVDHKYRKLQLAGVMSVRRWLPEPITEDSMGAWVCEYAESYSRDSLQAESFPWDEARQAKASLDRHLERKGRDRAVGLLKYVSDYRKEIFLSQVGRAREASFEVSNLGVCKFRQEASTQSVQVGRMIFSQSANIVGSALTVSVVTGGDGCLVLNFTWQEGVVDLDLVDSIMADVQKQIRELVGRH